MMEIEMPKIAVEENDNKSYAKVVVEPLEKGFGLTLGNALRRILLSALPGVAIQNIKFSEDLGIKHEFSAVPKVKEDVTEIILNLKCVAIKSSCLDKDYKKKLFKKAPKQITGYEYEIEACKKAIKWHKKECSEMPHETTMLIMKQMDEIRKQIDLKYPFE